MGGESRHLAMTFTLDMGEGASPRAGGFEPSLRETFLVIITPSRPIDHSVPPLEVVPGALRGGVIYDRSRGTPCLPSLRSVQIVGTEPHDGDWCEFSKVLVTVDIIKESPETRGKGT